MNMMKGVDTNCFKMLQRILFSCDSKNSLFAFAPPILHPLSCKVNQLSCTLNESFWAERLSTARLPQECLRACIVFLASSDWPSHPLFSLNRASN